MQGQIVLDLDDSPSTQSHGTGVASLAGRKVVLIIDESHHHATSEISRKLISDINPSLAIEASATPVADSPDEISTVYIEDVKHEGMIKETVLLQDGYGNELTGMIPPEIGDLTNLTYFLLSNNQLTGEIPSEIGNLMNLMKLYLHNNFFEQEIPQNLCELNIDWSNDSYFSIYNNIFP